MEEVHSQTDVGDNVEIALNTDPVTPPDGGAAAAGKVRSVVAIVLGVLTIVALIATTVAVWAGAIVFDSEQVADIVGDALAEPEVSAALGDHVTEQVFSAVDVDAVVSDVLPDNLDRLEPAIVAGLQTAVDRGVTRALASPEVQEIITQIVERAHSRAMDLLQGDGLSGAFSPSTARSRSTCCRSSDAASPGCRSSGSSTIWRSPTSPLMVTPPSRSPTSSKRPAGISRTTSGSSSSTRATNSPAVRPPSRAPSRRWRSPSAPCGCWSC